MRKLLLTALLAAFMCAPAFARDAPSASPTAVHGVSVTVEHTADDPVVAEGSTEEVIAAAAETLSEADKYFKARKEGISTALILCGAIAALLKLLLSLLRLTSPFWKTTRGKWVLRLITLTIGAIAGVLASVAGGMPWWDALIVFFGGPGAMLIAEYQKMIPFLRPKKEGG
jgi:hypothetical protein